MHGLRRDGGAGPQSSPRPSRSRASFTIRQKLTKAAPIPGTGPQGDSRGAGQQLSGTDGLGGGEDWSHQLPGPLTPQFIPSPNKTKANPAAPTSERREGYRRPAAHPAPPGSSRLQLPGDGSRGGSGGEGCDRGSPVQSLPQTQHLELRTAPRLIPGSPPPPCRRSQ